MPPRRNGIQVHKLLKRQGDQARRFQAILNKKQQKKDRERRRIKEYKKWLAQLEKKGELQQYSIKDWYGDESTSLEQQNQQQEQLDKKEEQVADQEKEIENHEQHKSPSSDQISDDNPSVSQQYTATPVIESFQQDFESGKREKMVRLQKRKNKHRKLTLRTRKGQPIMKYQMANLIEKLQK
ncbi:hypothetical protein GpartN1_g3694.t1 [Galdieria partita]|uniref:Uncharacterized protein n=1 Tax=Galdieria partita TaxID=83374 RepID=A0A9C7UQG9_9RHOD|nr:hypothetical protein GpartN1_g3694.t1 [Galdieria partita]